MPQSHFHSRFVPKDHQGVAPYQVRNPWYNAKAGAESVSLTKARTSLEEYRLKRSFPTEQRATASSSSSSSERDRNGVKMKRCSESDIPEDIRAKLPNVEWSREEECDASDVKQVDPFKAAEPFEFKKRNASPGSHSEGVAD